MKPKWVFHLVIFLTWWFGFGWCWYEHVRPLQAQLKAKPSAATALVNTPEFTIQTPELPADSYYTCTLSPLKGTPPK